MCFRDRAYIYESERKRLLNALTKVRKFLSIHSKLEKVRLKKKTRNKEEVGVRRRTSVISHNLYVYLER